MPNDPCTEVTYGDSERMEPECTATNTCSNDASTATTDDAPMGATLDRASSAVQPPARSAEAMPPGSPGIPRTTSTVTPADTASNTPECPSACETQPAPTFREQGAARIVSDWNRAHPVGQPVRFWTGLREGEGVESVTRSEASTLGGHTPVVWVEGEGSCVALTHVEPIRQSPLPSTCSECGTHEYAQDVMRRQEKAIHKARAERDAARLIVHGMWSLATPTRDTVDFWNQVIMRVYDWHGVDPQDGSVALDMSAFGRALRGEALDV